ncbi:putative drug exporter of the RND superfamily [Jatrophihabitans endophyticus]|uniref:Putative drug exporter of the RND superfamily n=1 Tax=Jatrophihabitans endophyticus TaxID=1206085 RepID=A0A1M5L0C0_9ACTN|nr:MMPL family transporter [Jatrophihabitans endophyticus]SHG58209.1 putative drug exporter of the RND superfamily [Jatrophihabitans endophyticus]
MSRLAHPVRTPDRSPDPAAAAGAGGTAARGGTVTVRMARWSATHPWLAIALWVALVVGCVALGTTTSLRQADDLDFARGQSGAATRWLHDAGLAEPDTENVLVTARSGPLDDAAARAALTDAARRLRPLPAVRGVGAVAIAPDRSAMTVQATLRDADADADDVRPLLAVTSAVQRAHPSVRVEQVGAVSLNAAVDELVGEDLATAAMMSTPVTLLILLVAFGAVVAAGVPVLIALSAVAAATGLSTLASHLVPDSGSTSAMILLMGMAVGVDYSLFYVKRMREEQRAGHDRVDAVELAAETSGHAVLVSGFAVLAAMLGLYLADDAIFDSLATGSITVVAIAVLGSLTVLPALLVKLGRAVDRPRVPVLWRLTAHHREPRVWPALLRPSLRHPARTLGITVAVLGALALPALGLHLQSSGAATVPDQVAAKHTLERLDAAFPDQRAETTVVVKAAPGAAAAVRAALRDVSAAAVSAAPFRGATTELRTSSDAAVHVLSLATAVDADSGPAHDGVVLLRRGLVARELTGIASARWAVGGETATNADDDRHLADRLPWVIGFVVVLTMLIMGWVFRSVPIALVTAAMNLLSAGVSFGVLVLVFQHSWADSLLGFESTGRVVNWIPLFMFAVLFGLSMDYHVFVISRVREARERGLPPRRAIRDGIVGSAGTVSSAALIMVSVFTIFAALHLVEMKQFGVGLAVAVLVDAIVVREIVLPSALLLLGDRVWPAAVRRPAA